MCQLTIDKSQVTRATKDRRVAGTRSPKSAAKLGNLIRQRRLEYELPMATVARHMGWDRQRLDNLENGKAVSTDVHAWVLLADRLGFTREHLLGLAWEVAKEPFPLRLPEEGDSRRELLLALLIEQHASDIPRLP